MGVYLDEASRSAHGIQVHRDSESVLAHFRMADEHMRHVMQFVTVTRLEINGTPSREVMEAMRKMVPPEVLSVAPRLAGFDRFQKAASASQP
jgi:hypothetical protein